MGSQQLLLIVVGVVILGIMVAVGVTMFIDQSASSNRDALATDLANFAAVAQGYYRRPSNLGGGQGSFNGLTISRITSKTINDNGTYELDPDPVSGSPAFISLIGTGKFAGMDGVNPVKVVMLVYADSMHVDDAQMN